MTTSVERVVRGYVDDPLAELVAYPEFCPIEAGLAMKLADNECAHGRLPGDRTRPCGCWPQEPAPRALAVTKEDAMELSTSQRDLASEITRHLNRYGPQSTSELAQALVSDVDQIRGAAGRLIRSGALVRVDERVGNGGGRPATVYALSGQQANDYMREKAQREQANPVDEKVQDTLRKAQADTQERLRRDNEGTGFPDPGEPAAAAPEPEPEPEKPEPAPAKKRRPRKASSAKKARVAKRQPVAGDRMKEAIEQAVHALRRSIAEMVEADHARLISIEPLSRLDWLDVRNHLENALRDADAILALTDTEAS